MNFVQHPCGDSIIWSFCSLVSYSNNLVLYTTINTDWLLFLKSVSQTYHCMTTASLTVLTTYSNTPWPFWSNQHFQYIDPLQFYQALSFLFSFVLILLITDSIISTFLSLPRALLSSFTDHLPGKTLIMDEPYNLASLISLTLKPPKSIKVNFVKEIELDLLKFTCSVDIPVQLQHMNITYSLVKNSLMGKQNNFKV